jgi:hypothetical protein
MSENIVQYNFESPKKLNSNKSISSAILKLHGMSSTEVVSLNSGRDKNKNYISLCGTGTDDSSAIKNSVIYLNNKFETEKSYAMLYFEQTDDEQYFAVNNDDLLSFDNESDCIQYLFPESSKTQTDIFYENCNKDKSVLLIQMKLLTKKALDKISDVISQFINNPNEINLNLIIDTIYRSENYIVFAEYMEMYDKNLFLQLMKSISFLGVKGKELYVGYEFEPSIIIVPEEQDNCSYNGYERNIKNAEGHVVGSVADFYLASPDICSIKAKFNSTKKGHSGKFALLDVRALQYFPYWNKPCSPRNYW